MTEKRFTANITHYSTSRNYVEGIKDNQSNTELKSIIEIIDLLNELHEENQTLKQTMKEVKDLLIEEVDVFSDKAIEHDVLAYKELQELDNKDAFYIADATKKAIKMLKELEND